MDIKQRFPTEASVQNAIQNNIAEFVTQVRSETGSLEVEYIKNRRLQRAGSACVVAGFFLLCISVSGIFDGVFWSFGTLFWLVLGGAGVGLLYIGGRKMKGTLAAISEFQQAFKRVIFPLPFTLFGLAAQRVVHTSELDKSAIKPNESQWQREVMERLEVFRDVDIDSREKQQVLQLLDQAELITESRNQVFVDDMFLVSVADKAIFVSELEVKHVTGSGKDRRVKNIFAGYFVTYDLDIELAGKTFVSTEGDTKGFGHQSFWAALGDTAVKATTLEWNDFESLLHVATTNPTEARYVLTPDFMSDLFDWWKAKKGNIRISFIGQRLYILFPDHRVRFRKSVDRISITEITAYLESVSLPLLHVLHLIQDVQEQFNNKR